VGRRPLSAKSVPLSAFTAWTDSADTDALTLVRGAIEALTAAPPRTPVILGVDDAHLLDDLSMFVVHQIVQRRAAKVVLIVHEGELIPLGLQDIWKGGPFDRLVLQFLSQDQTAALLATTLRGGPGRRRGWS
jgi:hypothetical protein